MNESYTKEVLEKQVKRLREEGDARLAKADEITDYLNGNPRGAIACSYYDGYEGGFKYGLEIDFVYIGSVVETKYGDILKVKGYDVEKDLLSFEGTPLKLDSHRISCVNSTDTPLRDLTTEEKWNRVVEQDITEQLGQEDERPY